MVNVCEKKSFPAYFKKFDAIAERVAKFKPFAIWNFDAFDRFDSALFQLLAPRVQIFDFIREMSFPSRAGESVFRANVDLKTVQIYPKTTAIFKRLRFRDFLQAEKFALKLARRSFGVFLNRNLRVLNSSNHFRT